MHSHQALASGLGRCFGAASCATRAMSTTTRLTQRRAPDNENAPSDTPPSKASSARLWKPSAGIKFSPSAQGMTWKPADGIVFSANKPLYSDCLHDKHGPSRRMSYESPVRETSPRKKAKITESRSCCTAEPSVAFSSVASPPVSSNPVGSAIGGGEEPLEDLPHRSTLMRTAKQGTPAPLAASTSVYLHQHANLSPIEDQETAYQGTAFSIQKDDETFEKREFRIVGRAIGWCSDLSTEPGRGVDKTRCNGNTNSKAHRKVFRYLQCERRTTGQRKGPAAKTVRLGPPKTKKASDEQGKTIEQKLWSQHYELRGVFDALLASWYALKLSQAEAYLWASSERAKAQVALIGYHLRLLEWEFKLCAHEFREFRNLSAALKVYSALDSRQQYLLLRRVRVDVINRPFFTCNEGYKSLIKYLKLFLETCKFNGRSIPDHIRIPVYDKSLGPFWQLGLSGVDKYNLYRLLFDPQISEQAHAAALLATKVQQGISTVIFLLKHLRNDVRESQEYSRSDPQYKHRARLYGSLVSKAARMSLQQWDISRQYEEAIIGYTNQHIPDLDRKIHREPDELSISCIRTWLPSPASDIANMAPPSLSPLGTSNAANTTDRPLSKRLHNSESFSNAAIPENPSIPAALHTSEYTNRGSSQLSFTPSNALQYSQSSQSFLSRTDSIDATLEPIEPTLENEDQAVDEQLSGSLLYQIPEAKLKEAMLSSRSTTAAYWRYSLYEHPTKGKVKVHYCKSKETTERTAQLFLGKEVVGFDIEWKPQAHATDGLKKNVSLVQLASEERIALFHIARYPKGETIDDFIAPTLKSIMEDPSVSKVGVSVKSDCTRLRKFMGIESRGLFELSHLYKLVKFSAPGNVKKIDKRLVSLATQVEEHLQLPLWKGDVRSSDWSTDLNYQQMQYAASDSYAGLRLYNTMECKRKALDPTPPRPEHAELNLPIRLANGQTVAAYEGAEDSAEKAATDEAEETTEISADDTPLPAPSIEEMAREFLDIAIEDSDANKTSGTSTKPPNKPPEVTIADAWVVEYRSSRPSDAKTKATPAFLRAYSLWHHQEVEVLEAAKLLRDPPLQTSTVCCYILEAVRIEKLPFTVERLREVLKQVEGTTGGRYQGLRKLVE